VIIVAKACAICGKTQKRGNNVSHAHNKTNKMFKPNLQRIRIVLDGKKVRADVCTRCIRSDKIVKAV